MRLSTSSSDDDNDGASSNNTTTSWVRHKERGKILYERGDYENALKSYRSALTTSDNNDDGGNGNGGSANSSSNNFGGPDQQEKQLLLSNIVACRLKIGGRVQAEAAVQDAKRCVAINPRWSKGHVRLASAYIALDDRAHSNEACNSLQTALRYDPGNSTARQMLVRELRRDHAAAFASSSGDEREPSPPPPAQNPNYVPPPNDATTFDDNGGGRGNYSSSNNNNNNSNAPYINNNIEIDDAFGGRFGFEYMQRQRSSTTAGSAGNYGRGNAYDQYNNNRYNRRTSGSSYDNYDSYDTYGGSGYGRSRGGGYGYGGSRGGYGGGLFDGGFQSMALLAGAAFLCHRLGINPWHAMLMLNMANGGRRFGGRRMYRGGGFGYGGGGYGYGGGMRYGGRPRRGRGWF